MFNHMENKKENNECFTFALFRLFTAKSEQLVPLPQAPPHFSQAMCLATDIIPTSVPHPNLR